MSESYHYSSADDTDRAKLGTNNGDVHGQFMKLHTEEVHGLYESASVSLTVKHRRLGQIGHEDRKQKSRNANVTFVGKSLREYTLGRPMSRLASNTKVDLRKEVNGWK